MKGFMEIEGDDRSWDSTSRGQEWKGGKVCIG